MSYLTAAGAVSQGSLIWYVDAIYERIENNTDDRLAHFRQFGLGEQKYANVRYLDLGTVVEVMERHQVGGI